MIAVDDQEDANLTQDELMQDSAAAQFGYYRPEIRAIPDPMSYKEAVRKYRQTADQGIADHSRHMKKLGIK